MVGTEVTPKHAPACSRPPSHPSHPHQGEGEGYPQKPAVKLGRGEVFTNFIRFA
jgi:hypothetical protein